MTIINYMISYAFNIMFFIIDADGDRISVSSDEELADALGQFDGTIFRLHIKSKYLIASSVRPIMRIIDYIVYHHNCYYNCYFFHHQLRRLLTKRKLSTTVQRFFLHYFNLQVSSVVLNLIPVEVAVALQ